MLARCECGRPIMVDQALKQQAGAWQAVVAELQSIEPSFMKPLLSGQDCAIKLIRQLARKESKSWLFRD